MQSCSEIADIHGHDESDPLTTQVQVGRLLAVWEEQDRRVTYPNVGHAPTLHLDWGVRRYRRVATLWLNPDEADGSRMARDVFANGPRLDTAIWDVTWHTWGRDGIGLENADDRDLASALESVLVALLRQQLIPDLRALEVQSLFEAVHQLSESWRVALPRPLRTIRWAYTG